MAKVALIQDIVYPFFHFELLSAIIRKSGHDCTVIVSCLEKDLFKTIKTINPDFIGFSPVWKNLVWVKKLSKKIKQIFNIPIIIGGSLCEFFDTPLLDFADYIFVGGAEDTLPRFLDNYFQFGFGRDERIVFESQPTGERDLLADRDTYSTYGKLKNRSAFNVFTGYGCPHKCSFCYNTIQLSRRKKNGLKHIFKRQTEDILNECLFLKKKYNLQSIQFQDDLFAVNQDWCIDFLSQYKKKVGVPFSCNIRANTAPTLIENIKKAGGILVSFGVESGDEKIRKAIYNKPIDNATIIDCARLCHKLDLKFRTYNIFGAPGETIESAWQSIRLNRILKPPFPYCTILQVFPRTPLYQKYYSDEKSNEWYQVPLDLCDGQDAILSFHNYFYFLVRKNVSLGKFLKFEKTLLRRLPLSRYCYNYMNIKSNYFSKGFSFLDSLNWFLSLNKSIPNY